MMLFYSTKSGNAMNDKGRWVTIHGHHVFVKDDVMTESEKIRTDLKLDPKLSLDVFRDDTDYLYKVLGAARFNNKEELEEIVKDIEAKGGKVIFHDDPTKIVYNAPIYADDKGILELYKNCSIAAVRHEYRHFLDDYERGYPGLKYYMRNRELFKEIEERGYQEELAIALKLGYNNIANDIRKQIEKRKKDIDDWGK